MKKLIVLSLVLLSTVSAMAESYNLFSLSFDNVSMTANNKLGDFFLTDEPGKGRHGSFNGLGIEYDRGFSISKKLPMFVEVGAKVSFTFYSKTFEEQSFSESEKYNLSMNLIRFNIPVSYAYRFKLNKKYSITPYAGLDLRFNLAANAKQKYEYFDRDDQSSSTTELSMNMFDEDDMGSYTFNRFQLGWHVGLRAEMNKFLLGLSCGTDFIPVMGYKGQNLNSFDLSLNLGVKF